MDPTISVVIPVYNRFNLLMNVVESVLAQTLPVSEIILVDDGSTDDTPERLPRYIADNARWRQKVVYFRQENQGQSAANNNGIAKAKGEWLAFNANDDLWLPQKLEWQFRALEQFRDCGVCFTDGWFMNDPNMKMTLFQLAGKQHNESIGVIPEPLKYVLEKAPVVGLHPIWVQTLVARSDLVRRVGGFDTQLRYGEDEDLVFRLACETGFCFVGMPMVIVDRTPREKRHVGAARDWHKQDFRLRMSQYRFEKRLSTSARLPAEVRAVVRKDLSAVHSEWANLYLCNREYEKARKAAFEAAKLNLRPNIVFKWVLTYLAPQVARKAVLMREGIAGV
jgi:glycosyltransferase involved in cell wall biosynthesis